MDRQEFDIALEDATKELVDELLLEINPAIKRMLFKAAWQYRPARPEFLRGIWMNGNRGTVSAVLDKPILWTASEFSNWTEPNARKESHANFSLRCIRF